MSVDESSEHFQVFAANLERAIARYGPDGSESRLERQRRQIRLLLNLERRFREALIAHRWGPGVYERFVHFICEKNILDARPYFRERQAIFTKYISKALKKRRARSLYRFRFNYTFVLFVLRCRQWHPGSKIVALARKIEAIRRELMEMNLPLAISQAKIFWSSTPRSHLSYMDLVQIHSAGLLAAIDKFVPGSTRGMTLPQILEKYRKFRSVAIGRMIGDRIEKYSISADTILETVDGKRKKIKDFKAGDKVWGVNACGQVIKTQVIQIHDHGTLPGFEVTFDDGYNCTCSLDHKFLTPEGMRPLKEIWRRDLGVFDGTAGKRKWMDGTLRDVLPQEKFVGTTSARLPGMSETPERDSSQGRDSGEDEVQKDGRLGDLLRVDVSDSQDQRGALQDLSKMQAGVSRGLDQRIRQVEAGKPGEGSREYGPGEFNFLPTAEGESRGRKEVQTENRKGHLHLEERKPGTVSRKYQTSLVGLQALENGSLASVQRDSNLDGGEREVFWNSETSRLRVSRPQDLDRSRRRFSFYERLEEAQSPPSNSSPRPDAQRGSSQARGRDSDSLESSLLSGQWPTESRLAPMAYGDAPLSETRSLVLRRIVRVRAVGPRRMYDLEVGHAKHNFLLPNGVVTSNSETAIHFYPVDKRKIYRANKRLRQFQGQVDYEALSNLVNAEVENPAHRTNASEIADLLAAASVISLNEKINTNDSRPEKSIDAIVDKHSAQNDDSAEKLENADAMISLQESIGDSLNFREKKIIAMKSGVRYE